MTIVPVACAGLRLPLNLLVYMYISLLLQSIGSIQIISLMSKLSIRYLLDIIELDTTCYHFLFVWYYLQTKIIKYMLISISSEICYMKCHVHIWYWIVLLFISSSYSSHLINLLYWIRIRDQICVSATMQYIKNIEHK